MGDLPLAAASIRLRGKPGRPRKVPIETAANGTARSKAGTFRAQSPVRDQVNSGHGGRRLAAPASGLPALEPRLLGLVAAARYLDLAPWTVRELEWRGVLPRVRIPLPNGGELRKLLFDRLDLDQLVERWKGAPSTPGSGEGATSKPPGYVAPGGVAKPAVAGGERLSSARGGDAR
jgi:hypothetical protein